MQEILLVVMSCCSFLVLAIAAYFLVFKKKKGGGKKKHTKPSSDSPPSAPSPPTGSVNVTGAAINGEWINTNISYYGQSKGDDNGEGFIGVDLFKLGQAGLKFNGQPVYPIAVHHDFAHSHLFKVMEVKGNRVKPFLGYVADICDRKDSSCSNVKKNGLNFLVDIHKTGFEASGNTNNGNDFTTGQARVVGAISPVDLPTSVWLQGENTYAMCHCTSPCDSSKQVWKQPKDFASCYKP